MAVTVTPMGLADSASTRAARSARRHLINGNPGRPTLAQQGHLHAVGVAETDAAHVNGTGGTAPGEAEHQKLRALIQVYSAGAPLFYSTEASEFSCRAAVPGIDYRTADRGSESDSRA